MSCFLQARDFYVEMKWEFTSWGEFGKTHKLFHFHFYLTLGELLLNVESASVIFTLRSWYGNKTNPLLATYMAALLFQHLICGQLL